MAWIIENRGCLPRIMIEPVTNPEQLNLDQCYMRIAIDQAKIS